MIRSVKNSRSIRLAFAGLVLALVATFAVALPRAQADSAQVEVVGSSGSPETAVDLSQLSSDVSTGGRTGYSLESLLDEAEDHESDLEWQIAAYVEIPKADGGQDRPSPSQIAATGSRPYLYVAEDGSVRYVNPASSREFKVSGQVRLGPDAQLTVKVKASDKSPRAGQKVTFQAQVSDAPDGVTPTYSWNFDDGNTNSGGSKVSHTFKKEGSFVVGASVGSGQAGLTGYGAVRIQAGKARDSNEDREGGGDEEDGGDTGETDAPDTPAYDGYSGGTGGSGYPGGSGAGPPSPSAPSSTPAPEVKDEPVEPVDDGLVEVSGELVSSSAPAEVIAQTPGGAPDALQEGTPDKPGGIAEWVWVTLGLMGLIAFGVVAEKRGSRLR